MPGSLRELEDAIPEGRIRFRRNPVLLGAFMSAVTDEDRWSNRWMVKERSLNKIDPAVAVFAWRWGPRRPGAGRWCQT